MNRFLIKVVGMILIASQVLCLESCGSPESDGEKAASAMVDCEISYNQNLEDKLRDYLENFEKYEFKSRVEARGKVDEIIYTVEQEYEKNVKKAEQQYQKLKKKHITNRKDNQAFEYAYNAIMEISNINRNGIPFSADIEMKIKSIIPPLPTIEIIKQDLVGRVCQDKEDGYFGGGTHEIKEGSIKEIKILEEITKNNEYQVKAILSLQDRPGSVIYKVTSEIKYILGDGDYWTIDYLGSNGVEVVKSGQFEKFITSNIVSVGCEKELHITNYSDATLLVGGILCINGEWQKFSVTVDPNNTKSIGGIFFGNVSDYEIHFVERK